MEMHEKDFARYAQIYGAALKHWPDVLRAAALAYSRRHAQTANCILDAENDVDAALAIALAPDHDVSSALEERILSDFGAVMRNRKASDRRGLGALKNALSVLTPNRAGGLRPALGMAMALLLIFGFASGYAGYASALDKTSSRALLATAFGTSETIINTEDLSS